MAAHGGASSLQPLHQALRPRLAEIDKRRRRVRNLILGGLVLALVGYASCNAAFEESATGLPFARQAPFAFGVLSVAAFGLALGKFAVPAFLAWVNYRARFKKDVMSDVVAALAPGARYFADRHLPRAVYEASGLYVTRASTFKGDDLVRGFVGETPYDISELQASYETGTRERRRTVVVFRGLFFQIDLDRDLRGRTLLFPDPDLEPPENAGTLERFTTGDLAFDQAFAVWTNDAEEARDLLSDRRRRALVAARETIGGPVRLAFVDRRVLGGIEYRSSLFEPPILRPVGRQHLEAMAWPLTGIGTLVAALDLDGRRRRPPDPEFHDSPVTVTEMEADTSQGDLTLARIAAETHELGESRPATLPEGRKPPAGVRTFGGELSVTYPFSPAPFALLVLSLALAVPAAAAVLNLASPDLLASLLAVPGGDPRLEVVVGWLARYPGANTLVAVALWWLAYSRFRRRPAAVTISRHGVRLRRALRPWVETIPLSGAGRVEVNRRTVLLVRTDRGFWRSFVVVSPPLADEVEARWVAAKLRAGLALAGWRGAEQ